MFGGFAAGVAHLVKPSNGTKGEPRNDSNKN